MNKKQPINNQLASYLQELEELFKTEYGFEEIPEGTSYFGHSDSELLILFFALKKYLSDAILCGTSAAVVIKIVKMIEDFMPKAEEATNRRIEFMKKLELDPEVK